MRYNGCGLAYVPLVENLIINHKCLLRHYDKPLLGTIK